MGELIIVGTKGDLFVKGVVNICFIPNKNTCLECQSDVKGLTNGLKLTQNLFISFISLKFL